jgi:uncharacterized membrane protein YiaA
MGNKITPKSKDISFYGFCLKEWHLQKTTWLKEIGMVLKNVIFVTTMKLYNTFSLIAFLLSLYGEWLN